MYLSGYLREDGKKGIRNHVAVIATCSCSSAVANQIGRDMKNVMVYSHGYGCGVGLEDTAVAVRVLKGIALNPNIGAILLVGLGCETISEEMLRYDLEKSGKPFEVLIIQNEGGSLKTIEKGRKTIAGMLKQIENTPRESILFSDLIVGLECGGSDALSGVTANPAVGLVSDWLVEKGATVILSETTEMIGAVHLLVKRAADDKIAQQLKQLVDDMARKTRESLGPLAGMVIAPGNMDGGMSSITEKSLGCITKSGSGVIKEVVEYAENPTVKGLVVMDSPGYDVESMAAMGAGGAQLMIFTTGRGTPAGFPGIPVIKVVSNSKTYQKMADDIDINAGIVVDQDKPLEQVRDDIISLLIEVVNGKETRAELNEQGIFGFRKVGLSF
jgi:altronate dehydratase large subunit